MKFIVSSVTLLKELQFLGGIINTSRYPTKNLGFTKAALSNGRFASNGISPR